MDYSDSQYLEMQDLLRSAETTGGLLRHVDNPYVLRKAIDLLTVLRRDLEQHGFQEKDPWILRMLYGLDSNGMAPLGLFHSYRSNEKIALKDVQENRDERKRIVLELIDNELKILREQEERAWRAMTRQIEYKFAAAVVPQSEARERILRLEAHLNREIERSINRLERLQHRRSAQLPR